MVCRLEKQGELTIRVTLKEFEHPAWASVSWLVLKPLLIKFRSFVLYHRMPYDRTFWSKLKDPWTMTMMYIASSPTILIRGSFFTIYLLCIVVDREEYQLMRFILGLKGTQFLSGILKLVSVCFDFWQVVVFPHGFQDALLLLPCHAHATHGARLPRSSVVATHSTDAGISP